MKLKVNTIPFSAKCSRNLSGNIIESPCFIVVLISQNLTLKRSCVKEPSS